MSKRRLTRKNARTVFENIVKRMEEDADDAAVYARVFNELLDEMASEDFFGTEGQCDPRGDPRE